MNTLQLIKMMTTSTTTTTNVTSSLLLILLLLHSNIVQINSTSNDKSTNINNISESEWTSFGESLTDSVLHGPIQPSDYLRCHSFGGNLGGRPTPRDNNQKTNNIFSRNRKRKTRATTNTNRNQSSICMKIYSCGYQFCDFSNDNNYNLPLYTLSAKSEDDIVKAMNFASRYDIQISVKTSGYSIQGSSTMKDSLLIDMRDYPKDDEVKDKFSDSCGTVHSAIGISGGETWNDVLNAIQNRYSIVSPNDLGISAAGGWLQGGGVAFNSRKYGLGVDNVLDFRVVLTNGTVVTADACKNQDLFWALRGGGGGTYGVVTHINYRLHPHTEIVRFSFHIVGHKNLKEDNDKYYDIAIKQWLEFFFLKFSTMDENWCGGHFGHDYGHMLYCGSLKGAKKSFLEDFIVWYRDKLAKNPAEDDVWGTAYWTTEFNSWYEYNRGQNDEGVGKVVLNFSQKFASPKIGFAFGEINQNGYNAGKDISVRLMPSYLSENDDGRRALHAMFMDHDVRDSSFGLSNYMLGGAINGIGIEDTAVHPAMRQSIFHMSTRDEQASDFVRRSVSNRYTGVEFNNHYVLEPDWRDACWGSNYAKLLELKYSFDSKGILNCWHCVGHRGLELPERITHSPSSQPSGPRDLLKTSGPTPLLQPSAPPSLLESTSPSVQYSLQPSTVHSLSPSLHLSNIPSTVPTDLPTLEHSHQPSTVHSSNPSLRHSSSPSLHLSNIPSTVPTDLPTSEHSHQPSTVHSSNPSLRHSSSPSLHLSNSPSTVPTEVPTLVQSNQPSIMLSLQPSMLASPNPSTSPTDSPTLAHSNVPSIISSLNPSIETSSTPTYYYKKGKQTRTSKYGKKSKKQAYASVPTMTPSMRHSTTPSTSQVPTSSIAPSQSPVLWSKKKGKKGKKSKKSKKSNKKRRHSQ